MSVDLEFFSDAPTFLAATGEHLAAEPVVNTVVTTVAHRALARMADGVAQPERDWWVAIRDGDGVVRGVAMRTAPVAPYPPFLLPMPDDAAVALARALHGRGEEVLGVNGALPAAKLCAAELARLCGGRVEVEERTRLHELGELVPARPVPGRLVAATEDDADLAMAWFDAFMGDADEQAGRPRGAGGPSGVDLPVMLRRIQDGELWFWVNETGERVHLTAVSPPAFGVARIGPVYTPASQRGRGWASAAVAEVSAKLLADGVRVCLYTDQANPTSNRIYTALGYRPVVDMANLAIVP